MLFFIKKLSKTVITRSRLHNAFLQNRSEKNKKVICKTKKLYCVSLLRKTQKSYYVNLNEKWEFK